MSFVRVNRYGPHGGGRKALKVKKKKMSVKQEWDNTVTDLTVHRATPEDLIRRHEIHKSKNRALVHWELQEKALKRKWKKQKPELSNLEKRRLSLMKEILSDQYQMQDVLEKSDHLMATAKDLFVDFPRRRTGFPNVTMAPDSSQGPIVVNQDPVTQAILSESVIEPQALNEVDDDQREGTVNSQSEESENELDNSLSSQSNTNADTFLHQIKEDNSELINKLRTDIQQKVATQSQITASSGTPSSASPSGEQKAALNATNAVKRIHTRLQLEESTETLDSSSVVRQVLNSRKQKQLLNKVKRKPDSPAPSKQKNSVLSASTASTHLPNSSNPSLDVLKHMIHEVEHEMEEYERWTGREVRGLQNSQGLTGFTLSLVSSLCRLVRYLKESELQLRKEVETRQQLEQALGDHRELIDALTAEILLLREENTATQARLQQYMITTDEQLISLTHAIKNCPVINNKESQALERGATSRNMDSPEGPAVNANVSVPLMFRGEDVVEFPQEDLPVKLSQVPNPPESGNLASSFPGHVCEPAVLLTPPRQKSNSEFSSLQDVLRRTVQTRPAPRIPPTVEIIEKEQNWDKKTVPTGTDIQNSSEESHLFTQRWRASHMGEDLQNKTQAPFVNLSQPLCNSHSSTQQSRNPTLSEEPPVLGDGQQLRTNETLIQRKDIMARIAELTLQNSAIKAHLNNIIGPGGEQGDGLWEFNKQETSHASNMTSTFPAVQPLTPSSMEERIAELNRQSMEARGKLLQLIEQQKLVGLNPSSPPVSPIRSPLGAWTEGGKRMIEVSIPVAEAPESSKCSTVSPTSGLNSRRSPGATSNSCSPLNATSGSGHLTPLNPRAKIEKQNEEGWFALATHMS
ncbi:spindle and centriole-associated protein 1 isoform X1 [Eubalaena glacialis]|uniref:spindle and centriole-associated protein 1 isoform X1 n=1 Tax=Eubalaena glacialis TaxID=27606 RepID=UPI002A5AD241|nr:spindle and centriole-associated protein 1 isoform X1 [Eubalaena glacialis]XP_061049063.1 spindle and centriole-associated protein 1 isoform X1 [Eubalaena glacialis]